MKTDKIALWQERIADKKASGLQLDEWCTQNNITKHAYYYWKRKIAVLSLTHSGAPLFMEVPTISAAASNACGLCRCGLNMQLVRL